MLSIQLSTTGSDYEPSSPDSRVYSKASESDEIASHPRHVTDQASKTWIASCQRCRDALEVESNLNHAESSMVSGAAIYL